MIENRPWNRIPYFAGGTLQYRDSMFNCRLENLSMSGALVTIKTKPNFQPGNFCVLELHDELVGRPLTIETLVVHQVFDYAGLKFVNLDSEAILFLEMIVERESNLQYGVV